MRWMREEVRHQKYRYDPRSPDWVGLALAKHLGLDSRADRKKLKLRSHFHGTGGGIDLAVIAATRPVASILTLARS